LVIYSSHNHLEFVYVLVINLIFLGAATDVDLIADLALEDADIPGVKKARATLEGVMFPRSMSSTKFGSAAVPYSNPGTVKSPVASIDPEPAPPARGAEKLIRPFWPSGA